MTYLPGNRVKLVAEWSHVEQTGTVREVAVSSGVPALGILYLVEWDEAITVARSVIREDELAPAVDETQAETDAWIGYITGATDERPA